MLQLGLNWLNAGGSGMPSHAIISHHCTGALHLQQLVNGFGDRMQSALVMPSLHFECIGNAPFPCHCAWKVLFKNPSPHPPAAIVSKDCRPILCRIVHIEELKCSINQIDQSS